MTPLRAPGRAALFLTLTALAATLGCARPSETVQTVDLLRLLPNAPHGAETAAIDVGTAEDQRYTAGLSWNETTPDGTTFSWSDGGATTFTFFLAAPRAARLVLRGFPWPEAQEAGGQSFRAQLNGDDLGEHAMDGSVQELSIDVPADVLRTGSNQAQLTYAVTYQPIQGEDEQRALGVAWDWARLDLESPIASPAPPVADLLRDRLTLPVGSWIEYRIDLEPASELVIDRLSGDGTLLVARRDESPGPSFEATQRTGRNVRLDLAMEVRRTVWLTLGNPGPGALRLRSPRVETRRTP